MQTFKVLSALLTYPERELVGDLPALRQALVEEELLGPAEMQELGKLMARLGSADLIDLQEDYVGLFDRSRSLSLHLFEHVHGDSRDRGQAMVDLIGLYRRNGLDVAERELPDYLPLFLEFLSLVSLGEARAMLADTAHILARIEARLLQRGSPYAGVLIALSTLAGVTVEAAVADEEDLDSPEAIDRAWEEVPVAFGGVGADPATCSAGCSFATTAGRRYDASSPGTSHA